MSQMVIKAHASQYPFRHRPQSEERYVEFRSSTDSCSCFIRQSALVDMIQHATENGDVEIIGRLGGRTCVDRNGLYVVIERAIADRHARGSAYTIESDIPAQLQLNDEFTRRCRAFDSTGWYHTHTHQTPPFYSGTDKQNQATWRDPHSIGIVLNPRLPAIAMMKVFRGPESEELTFVDTPESRRLLDMARERAGRPAKQTSSKRSWQSVPVTRLSSHHPEPRLFSESRFPAVSIPTKITIVQPSHGWSIVLDFCSILALFILALVIVWGMINWAFTIPVIG